MTLYLVRTEWGKILLATTNYLDAHKTASAIYGSISSTDFETPNYGECVYRETIHKPLVNV